MAHQALASLHVHVAGGHVSLSTAQGAVPQLTVGSRKALASAGYMSIALAAY